MANEFESLPRKPVIFVRCADKLEEAKRKALQAALQQLGKEFESIFVLYDHSFDFLDREETIKYLRGVLDRLQSP